MNEEGRTVLKKQQGGRIIYTPASLKMDLVGNHTRYHR